MSKIQRHKGMRICLIIILIVWSYPSFAQSVKDLPHVKSVNLVSSPKDSVLISALKEVVTDSNYSVVDLSTFVRLRDNAKRVGKKTSENTMTIISHNEKQERSYHKEPHLSKFLRRYVSAFRGTESVEGETLLSVNVLEIE